MDVKLESLYKDIEEIENIATMFYQGDSETGFNSMDKGTQIIMNIVDSLLPLINASKTMVNLDVQFLNAALTEILNAYENKDGILLADLLTYELLDYVQTVLTQCGYSEGKI